MGDKTSISPMMSRAIKQSSKVFQTTVTPNAIPMAEDIVIAINKIRAKNKLPPLVQDKRLNLSASQKAQDMIDRNYYSHTDPEGNYPWGLIKKSGYKYSSAGENIANKYNDQTSINEWMKSPEHAKNILNPKYTDVGVGRASGNGNDFNIIHFGKEKK